MPLQFAARSNDIEIMDDLSCKGDVVEQTLRELDFINNMLGGNSATVQGVRSLLDRNRTHISIVDLGCGSGNMLRILERKLRKQDISFTGVDANINIVSYALKYNSTNSIGFECANVLSEEFLSRETDIVVATLFFHHFTDAQLVRIISRLYANTRIGIVINDLHRHWFAYYSIKLLTKLFSKSSMVKFDAPLSVKRGFRRSELELILSEAGIKHYTLKWKWAFRWQIVIRHTAS